MRMALTVLAITSFVVLTLGSSLALAGGASACKTEIERAEAKLAEVQDREMRMQAEGWLLKAKGSHNLANYWDCEEEAAKALKVIAK